MLGPLEKQVLHAADQTAAGTAARAAADALYQPGDLRASGSRVRLTIPFTWHSNSSMLERSVVAKAYHADELHLHSMLAWSQAMAAAAGRGVTVLVQPPGWRSKHSSDPDLWVLRATTVLRSTAKCDEQLQKAEDDSTIAFDEKEVLAHVQLRLSYQHGEYEHMVQEMVARLGQLLPVVLAPVLFECREALPGGLEADWGVLPSLQCVEVPQQAPVSRAHRLD